MGRKSIKENKTVYQLAREKNDLTRAKAAELLDYIGEDRLERIEDEKSYPNPDEVLRMSECYKQPELCNHFCTHECAIGKKYVPEIEMAELPSIILETIASLNAMEPLTKRLIEISRDGQVTDDEIPDFSNIMQHLQDVSQAVETLNFWVEKTISEGKINLELLKKQQS